MKVIRKISEDEMIAHFLKGEINSNRFAKKLIDICKKLNVNISIIKNPDLNSRKENNVRKKIIGIFRGYGLNKELFENFPEDLDWEIVELNRKELEGIKYINYDYWIKLSKGTRLPSKAAESISEGIEILGESNNKFIESAKHLKGGGKFPKMIIVTNEKRKKLVVLEGHLRLTAYMLSPKYIPDKIRVILGVSDDIVKWDLY